MGINQFSDPGINLGNEGSNNNTDLSIANGRFENAKVDLSSTVAHINLQIIF
jgi:hypothetical protein